METECPSNTAGRKKILSTRTRRKLLRLVTSGQADTAVDVKKSIENNEGIHCSVQTIRNALKEEGLKAYVKPKKPKLSPRQKRLRMEFATRYKDGTIDDWKRVIWSDETKVNRLGSDGRKWVWRTPGKQLNSNHVNPTVKHGGGSLTLWGCMTYQGIGFMCKIEGGLNAELYTEILEDCFLKTVS